MGYCHRKTLESLLMNKNRKLVKSLAFSPDVKSQLLVSGHDDGTIRIWNFGTSQITESDGKTGANHADRVSTNCPEQPTSQAVKPLTDQGKEVEPSSAPASCPETIQNQHFKEIQHMKQQHKILENENYQLSKQVDSLKSEKELLQKELETLKAQDKELEAPKQKAKDERERRSQAWWCSIL
ncbi:uncharacterized protein N7483_003846 [Penicillium malachiteum]|uniref:uncharacterized protein n=1 Tax=Penicillium malachiteum TaxID=1324776 RepID=UPI002548E201|nr:uncharacterized protein N7483_003846 [Penicillium malachiteum]KAJ5729338.1 hypothetical protein N7483_003846 [Penicillium malachiteum]